MSEKLDRIVEYWVSSQRTATGPLAPADEERVRRLRAQLGTQVPSLDDRDPYTLLAEPLPAEVVARSGRLEATLRNASAGGIALATRGAPPPPLGEVVTVRARDGRGGVEYELRGAVVARVVKGEQGVSIALSAAPRATRIGGQSGVYARPQAPPSVTESQGTPRSRKGASGE